MHPTDERREAESHDNRERYENQVRCGPAGPVTRSLAVLNYMQTTGGSFVSRLAIAWKYADDMNSMRLMEAFGREYREYRDRMHYNPPTGTTPDADACGPAEPPVGGLLGSNGEGVTR